MSPYKLALSDGQAWHLVPTRETAGWVADLARTHGLRRCAPDGCPRLIFSRRPPDGSWLETVDRASGTSGKAVLPGTGWAATSLDIVNVWSHGGLPDLVCQLMSPREQPFLETVAMMRSIFPVHRRNLDRGGLTLHGALIGSAGLGVVLVGISGAGKSTCCRRLPPDWQALSDDATLVVRCAEGGYRVHPLPTWSERLRTGRKGRWDVESSLPLAGIFFIVKSEDEAALRMGLGKAAARLASSAMQARARFSSLVRLEDDRDASVLSFENACTLVKVVPAFTLHVGLHGRFWEHIETALRAGSPAPGADDTES